MRTKNSIKNVTFGLLFQVITIITSFITRTIFIKTLGSEYLGINGLFSNVISILSFAELGIGGAIVFNLYKPLAQKDNFKISALMNFYSLAYKIIGSIVFLIGMIILPFLKYIVKDYYIYNNLNYIFILFVLNSTLSYFMAYKKSLITADQKGYIINKVTGIFNIFSSLIQIMFLLITHNYIIYLLIQILLSVLQNIYISKTCDKIYPFIKENKKARLDVEECKSIFSSVYSLFLYKVSGIVINGTDNLVISIFLGVKIVGLYSNYTLIIGTVTTFLSIIFNSLTSSVGNLNESEDEEKKYFIYKTINFMNFWFYSFASICLLILTDNFIYLWIGNDYILDKIVVFVIIMNFYTTGMQNANTIFRDATGMFNKGRYKPLFAAVINLSISIILVQKIGLSGVFLGTIISRIFTYFWHDPYIIHKYIFNKSCKKYFIKYIYNLLILFVTTFVVNFACKMIDFNTWKSLILQLTTCVILINSIFVLLFNKRSEFIYLKNIFINLIKPFIKFNNVIKNSN